MKSELHVVFGAGQVGHELAKQLLELGETVRVVKRSPGGIPEGAETVLGDASDATFCLEAAAGANVVYHCMNPPYSKAEWIRLLPTFMDNLIGAAGREEARLVVLDNLYMIDASDGQPITEETAINPRTAKGEIRAEVSERLFDAHRRGEVQAVVGRASDFYGPGGIQTHFGEQFWKPALKGKTVWMLIDPDALHTYHFIPDVAAGLAVLGRAKDDVVGRSWMLPCHPPETARDLAGRFSRALDREIKVRGLPRVATKVMGVFVPIVREVDEMLFQWDKPFNVDDSRFRERFPLEPIDQNEAARRTVEWAVETYGS